MMSVRLRTLCNELENVRWWLIYNKLLMHLGKTESILFETKKKLSRINTLKVSFNGAEIVSQTSVSYLRIIMEQLLSCDSIAAKILSKCACKLRLLFRRTRFFGLHC